MDCALTSQVIRAGIIDSGVFHIDRQGGWSERCAFRVGRRFEFCAHVAVLFRASMDSSCEVLRSTVCLGESKLEGTFFEPKP